MDITWLDILLLIILLVGAVWEFRRGFGRAIFDLVSILIAFFLAKTYYPLLGNCIKVSSIHAANCAIAFQVMFIPILTILLILADLAYGNMLFSMDIFEKLFGGICGFAVGFMLAHALVFGIWIGSGMPHEDGKCIANSTGISQEFLTYKAYHNALGSLENIGQIHNKGSISE